MMRLRQIALATPELRSGEQEICNQLGVEVCYRDPGLSHFGLRHGLYAIGDQLLELVAPKQEGTTAGRFLDRWGEGGYMVLLQTDEIPEHKARVEAAGIRVVHDGQINEHGASIHGIHLHPKDVGGAILSLDEANPVESWLWAGQDWQYHSLDGVASRISAIEMQSDDPELLSQKWATAIDRQAQNLAIELDDAEIRFVVASDDRGDGFVAADLVATDRSRCGETLNICGFEFRLV